MKIHLVGTALFHADGQADSHGRASRISKSCEGA